MVASTPVFLQAFGKSLWAAGRGPQQLPDTELLRTGRIALLKPGQEVPLTVAWHAADGDPVRVGYGRGSLALPRGSAPRAKGQPQNDESRPVGGS